MTNAQDFASSAQAQALEAIRNGQTAALEAVKTWSQAVAKVTPGVPGFAQVPGVPNLNETVGDPAAIVDSVYDFAAQLLELNKQFVHSLLQVSTAAVEAQTEAAADESEKAQSKAGQSKASASKSAK